MTTPPVPPQHSGMLGPYRHTRLWAWRCPRPEALPAFDQERIPTVEQAVAQDARTRWIMLVALHGAEEVSLRFIETLTQRASVKERQRSLDWLMTASCITEHRHADRACFWRPRREWRAYAITPMGAALLARLRATATAAQLGIQGERPDLPRMVSLRWWRVVSGILSVALVALAVAVLVSLFAQFR